MRVASLLCLAALSCGVADPESGRNGEAGQQGQSGQNGAQGPQGPQGPAGGSAGTSGSRLKLMVLTSPDGAVQQNGLWDSERKEQCMALPDEAGQLRCFPYQAALTPHGYLDARCTAVAFLLPPGGCPNKKYGYTTAATCAGDAYYGAGYKFLLLSPVVPSMTYELDGAGACKGVAPYPGYTYFSGTPIPSSAFVALTQKTL